MALASEVIAKIADLLGGRCVYLTLHFMQLPTLYQSSSVTFVHLHHHNSLTHTTHTTHTHPLTLTCPHPHYPHHTLTLTHPHYPHHTLTPSLTYTENSLPYKVTHKKLVDQKLLDRLHWDSKKKVGHGLCLLVFSIKFCDTNP